MPGKIKDQITSGLEYRRIHTPESRLWELLFQLGNCIEMVGNLRDKDLKSPPETWILGSNPEAVFVYRILSMRQDFNVRGVVSSSNALFRNSGIPRVEEADFPSAGGCDLLILADPKDFAGMRSHDLFEGSPLPFKMVSLFMPLKIAVSSFVPELVSGCSGFIHTLLKGCDFSFRGSCAFKELKDILDPGSYGFVSDSVQNNDSRNLTESGISLVYICRDLRSFFAETTAFVREAVNMGRCAEVGVEDILTLLMIDGISHEIDGKPFFLPSLEHIKNHICESFSLGHFIGLKSEDINSDPEKVAGQVRSIWGKPSGFSETINRVESISDIRWQREFSPMHKGIFKKFGGDALIAMGYEKDHEW